MEQEKTKRESEPPRRAMILDYFWPGPFEPLWQLFSSQGLIGKWWHRLVNAVVIAALAIMVCFPLVEIVTRLGNRISQYLADKHYLSEPFNWLGISGSSGFVQYGTLLVGLIGAAIAAREDRLLSLSTGTLLPKGWPRTVARIISATVGGVVAVLLCMTSLRFVQEEKAAGEFLAYGIPVWLLVTLMPVGFGLIALSVLHHSAPKWNLRWIAPVAAAGILAFCLLTKVDPDHAKNWQIPAFILLGFATFLGAPIFVILGGATLILFWPDPDSFSSIAVSHHGLVTQELVPGIPLFTLAGYFLAESKASTRLVRVFNALFAPIPGGPAIMTALLCAFFTTFTGASGVTILALGGVVMPILISARYSERNALGLLTGAGSLGMLFPPCLPLILYAVVAGQVRDVKGVTIVNVFLGAAIPGILLVVMTAILGIMMRPKASSDQPRPRFDARETGMAIWGAKWELLLPAVTMVSLFSGLATPIESAAITALYAFVTQTFVCRDLSLKRDVPRVVIECGLVIGGVLLILGLAQSFTNYFVDAEVPKAITEWVTTTVHSKYLFLLLLNIFLLIVGGLVDVYPAIIIVVPLLVPIGVKGFGIDPIHLGIIFLANLEMGFMMPPLGMNLLLSSYRFKKPMAEVCRSILPILAVQFIGVLLITYVPPMTTWLPHHFGEKTNAPAQVEDQ
jgi:C4-dicarboxylate transporter, DctM subunit